MANAFATALRAMHADRNLSVVATWMPGGGGPQSDLRVILSEPDEVTNYGEVRLVRGTRILTAMVADTEATGLPLCEGDAFQIGTEIYVVRGTPRRDEQRLTWTAEVVVQA